LSSVELTTFTEDAVSARSFQAGVILEGLKETDNLPRLEAYSFDGMSC